MVFVCEEQSEIVQVELEGLANKIYAELDFENMLGFLKQSEANMYKNYCKLFFTFFIFLELPDTKCVLILNHSIDQFTFYNFLPAFDMNTAYSDELDEKMRNIRSFEGMYNVYE